MRWLLLLVGAALTSGSGFLLGLDAAARWRARPVRLAELSAALSFLETEMAVGRTPLPQAARHVAALAGETPTAAFFRSLADGLMRGEAGAEAWRRAGAGLAPGRPPWFLLRRQLILEERADLEPFLLLGEVIGASDLTDQLRQLALTRERLASRERQAAAAAERLAPLCRYTGLAGGLIIALLLV
jgi:stage III sporulation protein AB